jgi:hypothetical protein
MTQPHATQPRATAAAGNMAAEPENPQSHPGRPCWSFVAALFVTPLALLEYAGSWYFRVHPCRFGAFCHDDTQIAVAEVLAPWLLFAILWALFALMYTRAPADDPWLWRLSQVRALRELLITFAGITLIAFIWAWIGGRLAPPIVMTAPLVLVVAIHAVFWRPPAPDPVRAANRRPTPHV